MGKRHGSSKGKPANHKSQKKNRRNLGRPAAGLQPGASATPASTSWSHRVDSQALQKHGKPLAYAAIAGYLMAFVPMVITSKAGRADGSVAWRDLLAIPCACAVVSNFIVLFLIWCNILHTADTNKKDRSGATLGVADIVSTPPLHTPKRATTTAPAAPLGAAGGRAVSAVASPSSSAKPSGPPPTTVHEEASNTEEESLTSLQNKSEAIFYLDEVKRFLDEMQADAQGLTATAYRDIAEIEKAADTPAAQIRALHKVCGSLLDSFEIIPEQLTVQAEALQKFAEVFQSLCQQMEDAKEEVTRRVAEFEQRTEAKCREIDQFLDEMDTWMEPTQRMLLGEAAYTLASLAEEHVYGSKGSDFEHHLSLNQLHSMFTAGQLNAKQRRRWEEVMQFVDSQVSMEELLSVDSELRKACYGDAHGIDEEKKEATLEKLQQWAGTHYSQEQHPNLHRPVQEMLSILAQFSSKNMPCVPDCTFASKLHRSLVQKFFS